MNLRSDISCRNGCWLIFRVVFPFVFGCLPHFGRAAETTRQFIWERNLGNPVIALEVIDDRLRSAESMDHQEYWRRRISFFHTNSSGHNSSRESMGRLLDLLEHYSDQLVVVGSLKETEIKLFRRNLLMADSPGDFENCFGEFLGLLNTIRLGLISQIAKSDGAGKFCRNLFVRTN